MVPLHSKRMLAAGVKFVVLLTRLDLPSLDVNTIVAIRTYSERRPSLYFVPVSNCSWLCTSYTLVAKIVETRCTFHVFLSKVNNRKPKLYSVHKIVTSNSLSVSSAHD